MFRSDSRLRTLSIRASSCKRSLGSSADGGTTLAPLGGNVAGVVSGTVDDVEDVEDVEDDVVVDFGAVVDVVDVLEVVDVDDAVGAGICAPAGPAQKPIGPPTTNAPPTTAATNPRTIESLKRRGSATPQPRTHPRRRGLRPRG
ncbi:MAG: hypothetical protein NVSMB16_05330 [Acidimicrobiales bacterium]